MAEYLVPAGPGEAELVEKRSRFLGHVHPVESEEEARAFIAKIKKEHYDARHNCWCYIIKDGPERYSDDGEPQGTAGLPMLELFRREGLSNFVCVVTRYFGGVLLGAGGLLRAYSRAAKEALEAAGRAKLRPWARLSLSCPYPFVPRLKTELSAFDGLIDSLDYGAEVSLLLLLPQEQAEGFVARVFDISGGSLSPSIEGRSLLAAPLGGKTK